jgi:hypothetical protein
MPKKYGSQYRETLEEAGYKLVARIDEDQVILEDETGKRELWFKHDDNPGFTVEIDGVGYEFVRSASKGDEWWANLPKTPA